MHTTVFAPRDKEQRQAALLDAANSVFAERGFDAATTREIAERAGCAEGLIHRYFAGKRGLLLALLDRRAQSVADEYLADVPESAGVRETIESILLHEIDTKWERRDFMRVCISQAAIDPEMGKAVSDRVVDRRVEVIADKLRAHQEAGRIKPGADIVAMARTIGGLGFSLAFMHRIAFGHTREEAVHIARQAASALADGISNRPDEEVRP
jgi:AcrR family transcriptional regulator